MYIYLIRGIENRFSVKLQEGVAAAERRKEEEKEVAIAAVRSECALAVAAAQSERDEYLALYTKVPSSRSYLYAMMLCLPCKRGYYNYLSHAGVQAAKTDS